MPSSITHITDVQDPRIKEFSSMKSKPLENPNLFIGDSEKVFRKIMARNLKIHKIFCTPDFHQANSSVETDFFITSKKLMEKVVGYRLHHGVMTLASLPQEEKSLENLKNPVVLNGVTSAENVGTIARSMAALGYDSLIFDHKTVSPWSRRAIRASLGNSLFMKIYPSKDLLLDLKSLQERGVQIIASTPREDSENLPQFKPGEKYSLMIGSEGHGLEEELLKAADCSLRIPIHPDVDSFNAGVAAGILLYTLKESRF